MRIVKKRIDEIIPADYNPRKISKENLERLKKSIKEFGLVDPLVWNERTNRLIGGHQRLKILMEEGVKEVEVSVVNLPEDKEKALNIALNNPNLQGEWEEEKLTELLKELEEKEISDLTGFEEQEIDKLLGGVGEIEEDNFNIEESIKEPKYKIQLGEIWQLGEHRLMCGDATKKEDVEKLMNGKKAETTITDPPYNYGIEYNAYDDKRKEEEYEKFIINFYNLAKLVSKRIIISVGIKNLKIYYKYFNPTWLIVWIKKNCRTRSKLRHYSSWEPIIIEEFEEKKQKDWEIIWVEGKAVRPCKDLLEYNIRIQKNLEGKHPVPKPLGLIEELVSKFTQRNDIILDLFGGRGRTLIACEQLNRICYMMEIDPKYCSVIIERWENYTGKKAKKL